MTDPSESKPYFSLSTRTAASLTALSLAYAIFAATFVGNPPEQSENVKNIISARQAISTSYDVLDNEPLFDGYKTNTALEAHDITRKLSDFSEKIGEDPEYREYVSALRPATANKIKQVFYGTFGVGVGMLSLIAFGAGDIRRYNNNNTQKRK
ncbi:MAG: hypothetical protein ACI8Y7_000839 [Candidatus Woesearchaeota archaeon]|jgi:hypothetical protein